MVTVSPIFQVTKIQMRQGISSTLPGAPTSLSPPTFAAGLDIGEIGFATDTGRLFIGGSPSVGQVNYQRTIFPYQNIEVLTENSPVIPQVVGKAFQYLSSYGFYSASLAPSSAGWNTVAGAPTLTGEICAKMEYFAFNNTSGEPLRQGTTRILALSGVAQAMMIDDSISAPSAFTSITAPPMVPALSTTFGVQFIRNGANFTMEYINNLPFTIFLFFAFASPHP